MNYNFCKKYDNSEQIEHKSKNKIAHLKSAKVSCYKANYFQQICERKAFK